MFTLAPLIAHSEKLRLPKVIALIDIEETTSIMLGIVKTKDYKKGFTCVKVKVVLRSKDKRERI